MQARWISLLLVAAELACAPPAPESTRLVRVPAPSLSGSVLPNAPLQPALVALPPGYERTQRRYPVVYYLPGFTTDVTEYVDGTVADFHLGDAVRRFAATEHGRELVVVVVNGRNDLGGSFYVDSPVTGAWETYVVRDVVPFVESHYRVRTTRDCRGAAGESMGGFGTLRMAMRHPDVFGSAFAISPGLFDEHGLEDWGMLDPAYVAAWRIDAERMRSWPAGEASERFVAHVSSLYTADGGFAYHRAQYYAYGAAFAPAAGAGPPWVTYPFGPTDGWSRPDPERVGALAAGFGDLARKVAEHEAALRSLRGLGLDVGRNDRLSWLVRGVRRLAALLDERDIPYRLTEHEGGHVDRLGERIRDVMLPFFAQALCADDDGEPR